MIDRAGLAGGDGPRVAIIGAGPCGLAACQVLRARGLEPVVFEKTDRVGGNWVYSPNESHSSVYQTTHIISSKRLSQYRTFPMPVEYPDYPSHQQLLAYFEGYARQFGLAPSIRFRTEVVQARPQPADRWALTLGGAGAGSTEVFDHLLVANGHHWDPRWPSYPGRFSGQLVHSHAFKDNRPFEGRRVLVVGGGNSAADIAVETGRVSAHTGLSWRRGYYVVPKLLFGLPPDVLNARMRWLPARLRRWLHQLSWRVLTGGNKPYGLPEPDHPMLASHPVVNSELLYFIRHGRVHPYPDVARFDGERVAFTDGRAEPFDVVIAATGFRISFPFLDPGIVDFSEQVPLYARVFHPDRPTLYFIGLVQPTGSIWPLAEAQSELVAERILGRWRIPAGARERVMEELAARSRRYVRSPRHSVEVDYHEHLTELSRALAAGRRAAGAAAR